MRKNLIIKNATQLVTCSGFKAKQGKEMSNLHVIEDGALVIENGTIRSVGKTSDILKGFNDKETDIREFNVIDAAGKAVLPGFVDSHTHFVFGGYRAEEFSWRLRGDSYMDILERGGGILSTVKATRAATKETLIKTGVERLNSMLSFGVTTVEGKSGYGLDLKTEIKQLEVMKELNRHHPIDVVSTFLGAHAVPREFQDRAEAYLDFIMAEVLPLVTERRLAEFCDIFCEDQVFSIDQSRRLLHHAKTLGLKLTLHADEIVPLGGTELAAELGAVSADHLLHASDDGIRDLAKAGVVAALRNGAEELVDPRPWAVGKLAETFEIYPEIGQVLPAMGYGEEQLKDLETTINNTECDAVVIGTPIDLNRVVKIDKPSSSDRA